jgi:predicted AlkP superfamily phosphohydrolase/phosphomutase
MSDHGFVRFDRSVNLNTWLLKEGFLMLDDPANTNDEELLKHVNWSKTRAYALGLNGIYVNQQYRERDGVVAEGEETDAVADSVSSRLLQFRDPENGKPVVHDIVQTRRDLRGHMLDRAPDLIVGYYPGYRASWKTALGAVPSAAIEDNADEWRGDHCIASSFVPGVILSNRTSRLASPRLEDLTVTILEEFGITEAGSMEGRSIYSGVQ